MALVRQHFLTRTKPKLKLEEAADAEATPKRKPQRSKKLCQSERSHVGRKHRLNSEPKSAQLEVGSALDDKLPRVGNSEL